MAAYFECMNDGSTTQITDEYANYAFWKKGTAAVRVFAATSIADIIFPVPASGAVPMVAIKTARGVSCISQSINEGGNCRVSALLSDDTSFPESVQWFAFLHSSSPEIALQQTGELCLWNAAGEPVFDSDANYLRVVDFVESVYDGVITRQYLDGRDYAVVVCVAQWYVTSGSTGGQWVELMGMAPRITGSSARFQYTNFRLSGGRPNPSNATNSGRSDRGFFMIVDVTDL